MQASEILPLTTTRLATVGVFYAGNSDNLMVTWTQKLSLYHKRSPPILNVMMSLFLLSLCFGVGQESNARGQEYFTFAEITHF